MTCGNNRMLNRPRI